MLRMRVSGVLHWIEDRFGPGREHWPLLGALIFTPNIVHHADPTAFLRTGFVERNWTTWAAVAPIAALMLLGVAAMLGWLALTMGHVVWKGVLFAPLAGLLPLAYGLGFGLAFRLDPLIDRHGVARVGVPLLAGMALRRSAPQPSSNPATSPRLCRASPIRAREPKPMPIASCKAERPLLSSTLQRKAAGLPSRCSCWMWRGNRWRLTAGWLMGFF